MTNRKHYVCTVCGDKHYAKGLCRSHYNRMHHYGRLHYKQELKPENNVCSFEECTRERHGYQDVCKAHYAQRWRGKELTPLNERSPIVDGCRKCANCGVVKPLDQFYLKKQKNGRHNYTGQCRRCLTDKQIERIKRRSA